MSCVVSNCAIQLFPIYHNTGKNCIAQLLTTQDIIIHIHVHQGTSVFQEVVVNILFCTLISAFITLKELKHSKLSSVFFNTFVNIDKYLDFEQRDPVASSKTQNLSDWDKYAAEQYELLISEEELEE